jgi:predicted aspartyl protease
MAGNRAMWRLKACAALWAAAAFALPLAAQEDAADPPRTIAATLDSADRLTLPVHIAGQGPYAFVVDTGSQRTVLSAELARALGLPASQGVRIISISGPANLSAVAVPQLRYGEEEVRDLHAPVIGEALLGSAGILGLDSLKDKRLDLKFREGRIEIRNSRRPPPEADDDDGAIVVRAKSRYGQLILVNCRAGGEKVNVILDTGAQYSIGNMALFRKLDSNRLTLAPRPVTLVSVTGDAIPAQVAIVKTLTVGPMTVRDVPVVFTDAAPFAALRLADRPSMFLGMQILRLFDSVAIDFGKRHVDFLMPRNGRESQGRKAAASG